MQGEEHQNQPAVLSEREAHRPYRAHDPQRSQLYGIHGEARRNQHEHDIARRYVQAEVATRDVLHLGDRCAEQNGGESWRCKDDEGHGQADRDHHDQEPR